MFRKWIWPVLSLLLKFGFAVAVLTGVWFASALYHEKFYRKDADEVVQIRVRRECLRPEYVKDMMAAREYDLTARELDLLNGKMDLLQRRTTDLLDNADRVEAMRLEFSQGKVKQRLTGIGGPGPVHPKK